MTTTSALVFSSLQPVLVGTAFEDYYDEPLADDGSDRLSAGVVWCVGTRDFVRRHPTVTAAVDRDHPDGCTDLWVYVDEGGLLESCSMECLDLDDGLVGLPIEQALPVLAERIADVLG